MVRTKATQTNSSEEEQGLIVGDVTELDIVTILNRGLANKECIAVSVREAVNMGRYGLMVGQHDATASRYSAPFFDNLFWFGDGIVNTGDWLFVYTGPGAPHTTTDQNGVNKLYTMHWGKQHTMFANSTVVPILFRVDAVNILLPPEDQRQLPRLSGS